MGSTSTMLRSSRLVLHAYVFLFLAKIITCQDSVCKDNRPNWCKKSETKHYEKLANACKVEGSKVSTKFCCKTCQRINTGSVNTDPTEVPNYFPKLFTLSPVIPESIDCSESTYQNIQLVNARFKAPAGDYTSSYTYQNMHCEGMPASNAIDRSVCQNKCSAHSDRSMDGLYPLLVDLKSPTTIDYIVIYGRQDTDWGYHGNDYANLVIKVDGKTKCVAREFYGGTWRRKHGLEKPMFYDCEKVVDNAKSIEIPIVIAEVQVGWSSWLEIISKK